MFISAALVLFGVGAVLAGGIFAYVFVTVHPATGGLLAEVLLVGALFLGITAVLAFLGLLGRRRRGDVAGGPALGAAFREGTLIAVGLVSLLLLQRARALAWWNVLLTVAVLVLLDSALVRRARARIRPAGV